MKQVFSPTKATHRLTAKGATKFFWNLRMAGRSW
jgi:hypothetical protein